MFFILKNPECWTSIRKTLTKPDAMFNSPLLDVTIGLIFIFLIYSLLATSINEAIATLFSFRSRMLKNAIITGMLSDTSKDSRWKSIRRGIGSFFMEIIRMFAGFFRKTDKDIIKLGDKFFDHPLIKNYGSSRIFPLPSYIPVKNFSTVLLDVLKNEFSDSLEAIAQNKFSKKENTANLEEIMQNLQNSSDAARFMELLNYYEDVYSHGISTPRLPVIDKETLQILQMHLRNSLYNIEKFVEKIEGWFDDTMKRVEGWYKRQSQAILFIIGLVLAMSFNVDVIKIAGRLSTDKTARDKLIQFSIQAADKYKDDPRVINTTSVIVNGHDTVAEHNEKIFVEYSAKINSLKTEIQTGIDTTNEILAIGWGKYGGNTSPFCKTKYILSETFGSARKILAFLILAFAVSLGAPFWFDLLNKLVKLRGSGQKENDGGTAPSSAPAAAQAPVTVTVNTKPAGEEAVG